MIYEAVKRGMDILIAGTAAIVTSPLLALIALAIRIEDRGPALLRQQRVGLHNRDFELLKFRTMVDDAHKLGTGWLIAEGDPRITRVGGFLRRWSLDELPQMFNVLRGEMSVVGPRPTLQYQVDAYTPHQRRRLEMRPGLTGLAQVSGRNRLTWPERIELDIQYIDNWSLALDLQILLRTLGAVLKPDGIYGEGWAKKQGDPGYGKDVNDTSSQ